MYKYTDCVLPYIDQLIDNGPTGKLVREEVQLCQVGSKEAEREKDEGFESKEGGQGLEASFYLDGSLASKNEVGVRGNCHDGKPEVVEESADLELGEKRKRINGTNITDGDDAK